MVGGAGRLVRGHRPVPASARACRSRTRRSSRTARTSSARPRRLRPEQLPRPRRSSRAAAGRRSCPTRRRLAGRRRRTRAAGRQRRRARRRRDRRCCATTTSRPAIEPAWSRPRLRELPLAPLLAGGPWRRRSPTAATTRSWSTSSLRGVRRASSKSTGRSAPSCRRGVAVVGARADRRPHLREALSTALHVFLDDVSTTPTTSCAGTSTSALRRPGACDCAPTRRSIARGEKLKAELLAHPSVRAWMGSLWSDLKRSVLARRPTTRTPTYGAGSTPRMALGAAAAADDPVAASEGRRGAIERVGALRRRELSPTRSPT